MKMPIKKYEMDEALSWEERYRQLEAHHKEEAELLMAEVAELRELVVNLELTLEGEEKSSAYNACNYCDCQDRSMFYREDEEWF